MLKRYLILAGLTCSFYTYSLPSMPEIAQGEASFHADNKHLSIEVSDASILDYSTFHIEKGESVRFIQPSETSRVLNRVHDQNPSQINGGLSANGQVYLVNPFGIYFGEKAVVDTAGLIAAAASISVEDFLSGKDLFTDPSGKIDNKGTILSKDLTFIGSEINNSGTIQADRLRILRTESNVLLHEMGSYTYIKLDDAEKNEKASLIEGGDLTGLALHHSGSIKSQELVMDADDGILEVFGSVDLSSDLKGGSGVFIGDYIDTSNAYIDASGNLGGGSIKIGGDLLGKGFIPRSIETKTDEYTQIIADAIDAGNGGTIVLWSGDFFKPSGSYSVRGGANGGDGGYIETSGTDGVFPTKDLFIEASAPHGTKGTWVIDPDNTMLGGTVVLTQSQLNNLVGDLSLSIQSNESGNLTLMTINDSGGVEFRSSPITSNGDITINVVGTLTLGGQQPGTDNYYGANLEAPSIDVIARGSTVLSSIQPNSDEFTTGGGVDAIYLPGATLRATSDDLTITSPKIVLGPASSSDDQFILMLEVHFGQMNLDCEIDFSGTNQSDLSFVLNGFNTSYFKHPMTATTITGIPAQNQVMNSGDGGGVLGGGGTFLPPCGRAYAEWESSVTVDNLSLYSQGNWTFSGGISPKTETLPGTSLFYFASTYDRCKTTSTELSGDGHYNFDTIKTDTPIDMTVNGQSKTIYALGDGYSHALSMQDAEVSIASPIAISDNFTLVYGDLDTKDFYFVQTQNAPNSGNPFGSSLKLPLIDAAAGSQMNCSGDLYIESGNISLIEMPGDLTVSGSTHIYCGTESSPITVSLGGATTSSTAQTNKCQFHDLYLGYYDNKAPDNFDVSIGNTEFTTEAFNQDVTFLVHKDASAVKFSSAAVPSDPSQPYVVNFKSNNGTIDNFTLNFESTHDQGAYNIGETAGIVFSSIILNGTDLNNINFKKEVSIEDPFSLDVINATATFEGGIVDNGSISQDININLNDGLAFFQGAFPSRTIDDEKVGTVNLEVESLTSNSSISPTLLFSEPIALKHYSFNCLEATGVDNTSAVFYFEQGLNATGNQTNYLSAGNGALNFGGFKGGNPIGAITAGEVNVSGQVSITNPSGKGSFQNILPGTPNGTSVVSPTVLTIDSFDELTVNQVQVDEVVFAGWDTKGSVTGTTLKTPLIKFHDAHALDVTFDTISNSSQVDLEISPIVSSEAPSDSDLASLSSTVSLNSKNSFSVGDITRVVLDPEGVTLPLPEVSSQKVYVPQTSLTLGSESTINLSNVTGKAQTDNYLPFELVLTTPEEALSQGLWQLDNLTVQAPKAYLSGTDPLTVSHITLSNSLLTDTPFTSSGASLVVDGEIELFNEKALSVLGGYFTQPGDTETKYPSIVEAGKGDLSFNTLNLLGSVKLQTGDIDSQVSIGTVDELTSSEYSSSEKKGLILSGGSKPSIIDQGASVLNYLKIVGPSNGAFIKSEASLDILEFTEVSKASGAFVFEEGVNLAGNLYLQSSSDPEGTDTPTLQTYEKEITLLQGIDVISDGADEIKFALSTLNEELDSKSGANISISALDSQILSLEMTSGSADITVNDKVGLGNLKLNTSGNVTLHKGIDIADAGSTEVNSYRGVCHLIMDTATDDEKAFDLQKLSISGHVDIDTSSINQDVYLASISAANDVDSYGFSASTGSAQVHCLGEASISSLSLNSSEGAYFNQGASVAGGVDLDAEGSGNSFKLVSDADLIIDSALTFKGDVILNLGGGSGNLQLGAINSQDDLSIILGGGATTCNGKVSLPALNLSYSEDANPTTNEQKFSGGIDISSGGQVSLDGSNHSMKLVQAAAKDFDLESVVSKGEITLVGGGGSITISDWIGQETSTPVTLELHQSNTSMDSISSIDTLNFVDVVGSFSLKDQLKGIDHFNISYPTETPDSTLTFEGGINLPSSDSNISGGSADHLIKVASGQKAITFGTLELSGHLQVNTDHASITFDDLSTPQDKSSSLNLNTQNSTVSFAKVDNLGSLKLTDISTATFADSTSISSLTVASTEDLNFNGSFTNTEATLSGTDLKINAENTLALGATSIDGPVSIASRTMDKSISLQSVSGGDLSIAANYNQVSVAGNTSLDSFTLTNVDTGAFTGGFTVKDFSLEADNISSSGILSFNGGASVTSSTIKTPSSGTSFQFVSNDASIDLGDLSFSNTFTIDTSNGSGGITLSKVTSLGPNTHLNLKSASGNVDLGSLKVDQLDLQTSGALCQVSGDYEASASSFKSNSSTMSLIGTADASFALGQVSISGDVNISNGQASPITSGDITGDSQGSLELNCLGGSVDLGDVSKLAKFSINNLSQDGSIVGMQDVSKLGIAYDAQFTPATLSVEGRDSITLSNSSIQGGETAFELLLTQLNQTLDLGNTNIEQNVTINGGAGSNNILKFTSISGSASNGILTVENFANLDVLGDVNLNTLALDHVTLGHFDGKMNLKNLIYESGGTYNYPNGLNLKEAGTTLKTELHSGQLTFESPKDITLGDVYVGGNFTIVSTDDTNENTLSFGSIKESPGFTSQLDLASFGDVTVSDGISADSVDVFNIAKGNISGIISTGDLNFYHPGVFTFPNGLETSDTSTVRVDISSGQVVLESPQAVALNNFVIGGSCLIDTSSSSVSTPIAIAKIVSLGGSTLAVKSPLQDLNIAGDVNLDHLELSSVPSASFDGSTALSSLKVSDGVENRTFTYLFSGGLSTQSSVFDSLSSNAAFLLKGNGLDLGVAQVSGNTNIELSGGDLMLHGLVPISSDDQVNVSIDLGSGTLVNAGGINASNLTLTGTGEQILASDEIKVSNTTKLISSKDLLTVSTKSAPLETENLTVNGDIAVIATAKANHTFKNITGTLESKLSLDFLGGSGTVSNAISSLKSLSILNAQLMQIHEVNKVSLLDVSYPKASSIHGTASVNCTKGLNLNALHVDSGVLANAPQISSDHDTISIQRLSAVGSVLLNSTTGNTNGSGTITLPSISAKDANVGIEAGSGKVTIGSKTSPKELSVQGLEVLSSANTHIYGNLNVTRDHSKIHAKSNVYLGANGKSISTFEKGVNISSSKLHLKGRIDAKSEGILLPNTIMGATVSLNADEGSIHAGGFEGAHPLELTFEKDSVITGPIGSQTPVTALAFNSKERANITLNDALIVNGTIDIKTPIILGSDLKVSSKKHHGIFLSSIDGPHAFDVSFDPSVNLTKTSIIDFLDVVGAKTPLQSFHASNNHGIDTLGVHAGSISIEATGNILSLGALDTSIAPNQNSGDITLNASGSIEVLNDITTMGVGTLPSGRGASGGDVAIISTGSDIIAQDIYTFGAEGNPGGSGGDVTLSAASGVLDGILDQGEKIPEGRLFVHGDILAAKGHGASVIQPASSNRNSFQFADTNPMGVSFAQDSQDNKGGVISLNKEGRTHPLATASIASNPKSKSQVSISGDSIVTGKNENYTTFSGLQIVADNSVNLGNATVLGDLNVHASEIVLDAAEAREIYKKLKTDRLVLTPLSSTSLVAKGHTSFSGDFVLLGDGDDPRIQVQPEMHAFFLEYDGHYLLYTPIKLSQKTITRLEEDKDKAQHDNPFYKDHKVIRARPKFAFDVLYPKARKVATNFRKNFNNLNVREQRTLKHLMQKVVVSKSTNSYIQNNKIHQMLHQFKHVRNEYRSIKKDKEKEIFLKESKPEGISLRLWVAYMER